MSEAAVPLEAVRPVVRLKPRAQKRLVAGYPWVYSNEVEMDAAARSLPLGSVVRLESSDREGLGTAFFNKLPLIAARVLSRDPDIEIDEAFLADRLERALALRERLVAAPYYRLVHAEADGLPGLIVDRFDSALVLQLNTAGMERLRAPLLAALERLLAPGTIALRNDSQARRLEGLESEVRVLKGTLSAPIEVIENGARYLADLREGQKTGWFFDQRENRAWIAPLAEGARVLEAYCYTGGFTMQAARAGAEEILAIDRSEPALTLAAEAAKLNGVEARCQFKKAEVFAELQSLARAGERFELVIADPPAFVKSKRDFWQGAKGYRKLARLAASLVAPGGCLFIASCSHHMDPAQFAEQVRRGLNNAGRQARILRSSGAGPDHPVHPALPESAYLKALVLALD
ncbi:MAG: class I SAM-dependent rRNA methyltransferase [Kiloniellales bacterium]|nr:class I SAM-dependent rRNA methyltransferase [Kiloniellales bacterium]